MNIFYEQMTRKPMNGVLRSPKSFLTRRQSARRCPKCLSRFINFSFWWSFL